MIHTNSELRAEARVALKGRWATAVLLTLVYLLLSSLASLHWLGFVFTVLVMFPMAYGYALVFLDIKRNAEDVGMGKLFVGFSDYGRILGTVLLVQIYIYLWTLLLIIPGIVKGYSYSMTYFVMRDNPDLSYNAAIERSMKLMSGHKMKLFLLDLSFIGWAILSIFTLGIGLLWLMPYVQTAHAAFYENLIEEKALEDIPAAEAVA